MRSLSFIAPLMLLGVSGASVAATDINLASCEIESPYSVTFGDNSLRFERKGDDAHVIELSAGGLRLDGRDVDVSGEDRARLLRLESEARRLAPEAKALALDAIDIAFRAVEQVGLAFSSGDAASREATAEKLATSRMLLNRRIEAGFDGREPLGAEQIDNLIAESVAGLMPVIAAVAVRAALSGDEAAIENMAARMEAELEQELEQRGREIEARAEALCLRVAELDRIENGLSTDILDGNPLNLIEFGSAR
jgi:hypothetical protein